MSDKDISDQLIKITASVLNVSEDQINDESSPDSLAGWDSVAHLNLVMSIEDAFGVSFSPEETMEMTSVRLMKMLLVEKLGTGESHG